MLFNSYEFIFTFLPITFFIYFYLNHKRLTEVSKCFLLFSSLFFYAWWNVAYLPIIISSILFNYLIGISLNKDTREGHYHFSKKSLLTFGIVSNIVLLGYFKYMDFFLENINLVSGSNFNLLHLALPLAISFFTFQQIAYLVDSYRQETKEYDFLNYSLFVTFFPQLIAGPIVHHKEIIHQFIKPRNKIKNYNNIARGIFIFSLGLFKKVVIADTFAVWATQGFDVARTLNLLEAWVTSLSYTFQLYFDFSGYTDMAIGIALLFNIRLPINFNSPYKATSIIEVWQKWHITLTNFISTYIFKPMLNKFKKKTFTKAMIVTLTTFVIVGLWHGASWMFVIFGLLHGIAIIIVRIYRKKKLKMNKVIAWFLTFNFINFSLVFFRAKEWDDAVKILSSMFSLDNIILPVQLENKFTFLINFNIKFGNLLGDIGGDKWTIFYLIVAFIIILFFKNSTQKLESLELNYKTVLLTFIYFTAGILSINKTSKFLYFNF